MTYGNILDKVENKESEWNLIDFLQMTPLELNSTTQQTLLARRLGTEAAKKAPAAF